MASSLELELCKERIARLESEIRCIRLEAEIRNNAEKNEIELLKKRMKNVTSMVYQLYGGLLNQKTQNKLLKHYTYLLLKDDPDVELGEMEEKSEGFEKENMSFKTHQGEKNEEDIQSLRERISSLEVKESK